MKYTIRKATPNDVRPALDLAMRVFMEFEAPAYGSEAVDNFRKDVVENEDHIRACTTGRFLMFVAFDGDRIVGVIDERGNGHICILFVDGAYHRQGIATALMNHMVCALKLNGFDKITLNSSPYGLPFYKQYGFIPADSEQRLDGFIFTPMVYTPNEIWDVYDCSRNKTGRYAERGRPMAAGDYHVVVQVWKHNSIGEWLIDKRANRDSNIDGMWETTGGSALAGDDSLTAALRETKEELGIDLNPEKGTLFCSIPCMASDGHCWFQDVWVFEHDCPVEAVTFQESETCDAMWATADKIREMIAAGQFLGYEYYPYFDEMTEKWGGRRQIPHQI